MGRVQVVAEVPGPLAAVERRWHEPAAWGAFVDGFERVVSLDPAWPEPGAMLAWDSHPDGRGLVIERVVTREPGSFLEVAVHDRQLTGTQRVAFGVTRDLEAVRVALALDYELTRSGPLMRLADPLFVRRALRDSLRRTLDRLAGELECRRRPAP